MLDISRTERSIILAFLILGLLYAGLSYHVKTKANSEIKAIHVDVPHVLININTASEFELEYLPGIGPVLAGDIVAHRETIEEFIDIEQLKDIKGIGDKKFEKIREIVTINE